ncbi:tRNA pseudouridine(38-40) synthase TruA [Pseudohoeflea coraliihabitans]|uniref:tRNA pseudouridine synthase A n=1 Tax=Pseudohoeflea coraliihabitans TaxID=2860393 RepID=A0ABS6WP90_9HYPH|nr:tRNA pseudouridine(38-40) synthase TruA [Pseudohoeflea sp. DP4N28-3]MBW3097580.1 tRNA pseudouridine(38-40) synthase TruA [Pseudohoeflea sp. DP4N28-3]
MPRYRITVEYDGSNYAGWQRQRAAPSIQQALETAIAAYSGEKITVHGAGRTDAGVHARGQVAHFDLQREWDLKTVRDATNAHLAMARERIAVLDARFAAADFHARFSARRRHYLYRFIIRRPPLILDRQRAWRVNVPLDAAAMHAAAQVLVGRHDFTTFRSVHCQAKSPVKTLDRLDVRINAADGAVELHATAPSFLHNQIRSFAGTLKHVGEGKWSREDVAAALKACDRTACGTVAPPEGLYFMSVDY